MRSVVVIPSIGCSARLSGVVRAGLASGADEVAVLENQDGSRHDPTALMRLHDDDMLKQTRYERLPGLGLYAIWNRGMAIAQNDKPGPAIAVILNDDIEIPSGTIRLLINTLKANPSIAVLGADYKTPHLDPLDEPTINYCRGTYRSGGIGGFAFACRADLCRVDEQFEWWGGDDDLVNSAVQAGFRTAVLLGAPVRHPEPETSAVKFPELNEAKDRDRARMLAKWGETW